MSTLGPISSEVGPFSWSFGSWRVSGLVQKIFDGDARISATRASFSASGVRSPFSQREDAVERHADLYREFLLGKFVFLRRAMSYRFSGGAPPILVNN